MLQLGVSNSMFLHGTEALVSPILVRPVREQLEHDRIIRLLQAKCRRRYEVGINPGTEQNRRRRQRRTRRVYPDLVLQSLERGHRLQAVVEVETGESVNHLEALAEWAHFPEAARGVSPVCSGSHGRCGAPAVSRTTRSRSTRSGAITPSATKCGSPTDRSREPDAGARRGPRRPHDRRQPARPAAPEAGRPAAKRAGRSNGRRRDKRRPRKEAGPDAEAKVAGAVRPILP